MKRPILPVLLEIFDGKNYIKVCERLRCFRALERRDGMSDLCYCPPVRLKEV